MKKRLFSLLAALLLVALLCVPAFAEEDTEHFVYDLSGILSSNDAVKLNEAAKEVSLRHGCGVYITVFEDMDQYGFSDIERFAEEVYAQWELGLGADRTCIILCMSMAERDYDLCAHGDAAHDAFTDYGKEVLADEFKDNFRGNDWAGGFADYIEYCDYMLTRSENGDPIDVPQARQLNLGEKLGRSAPIGLIVGIIIAFIYCGSLKSKMKTAKIAHEAAEYIARQGVMMHDEQDMFTHTTVTRQRIEHDNDSRGGGHGGTSVNSGGFSHSSGHF